MRYPGGLGKPRFRGAFRLHNLVTFWGVEPSSVKMLIYNTIPTKNLICTLIRCAIREVILLNDAIFWQHQIFNLVREDGLKTAFKPSENVLAEDAVFVYRHHRFVLGLCRCKCFHNGNKTI